MSEDPPKVALAQRWNNVQSHLNQLLHLEPGARAGLLSQLSHTQPAIAALVRELLQDPVSLSSLSNPWLDTSPELTPTVQRPSQVYSGSWSHSDPASGLQSGMLIGPYRLISELGCGGMSSVWLAERDDGRPKRQVALKLPCSASRMQFERFARERDLLAALTHPQIARLYDAGITASGQPYLAMEYVAGTALLESCDERKLSVRERLELFLQVLGAVQFAHAQLIIHRDLKPSNILVTPEARAVLLDFGIGKLLTDGVAHATQLTQLGGRALTPDYASPEQIAGQPLGVASDIYSLGVVLYELLTGMRPHRPKRDSLGALEDAILRDELRRPSQADITEQAAAARGTSKRALTRVLAGDLDTIVLQALHKRPADRYASVTAFAADLGSYLQQLPISARPPSFSYRMGRFITRHRLPVSAALLAICAVLSAAGMAVWQARAATAARDRAVLLAARNEATSEFLNTVLLSSANVDKPITTRELRERSEALAAGDAQDLPENRAAVLHMLASSYTQEGDWEHAERLLQQALGLLAKSSDQAQKSLLSCSRAFVASQRGDPDVALPKAVAALQAEIAKLEDDPRTASECLLELVEVCNYACSSADRLRHAEEGLRRIRQVPGPSKTEALLLASLGSTYAEQDLYAQANQYYQRALDEFVKHGTERSRLALLVLVNWAQAVADAGVPERAVAMYERKLRIEAERDPEAEPAALTLLNYGNTLIDAGRLRQARAVFERLASLRQKPEQLLSASMLLGVASMQMALDEFEPATQSLQRIDALRASNQMLAPQLLKARTVLAGHIALLRGDLAEARKQLELRRPKNLQARSALGYFLTSADIENAAGDHVAAARHAQRSIELATAFRGGLPYTKQVGAAWYRLGRAQLQLGQSQAARKSLQTAALHLAHTVAEENPMFVEVRKLLEH